MLHEPWYVKKGGVQGVGVYAQRKVWAARGIVKVWAGSVGVCVCGQRGAAQV